MQSKRKRGFCSNCVRNVPFIRHINTRVLRMFDRITLGCLSFTGLGPWYCIQCDKKLLFVKQPSKRAAEYVPIDTEDQNQQTEKWKRRSESEELVEGPAVAVGNYLKTEGSLLANSTRLSRFSEKYRDSIVRKVLAGAHSLARVREENGLSEAEILCWTADHVNRLEQEIQALKFQLEASHRQTLESEAQFSSHRPSFDPNTLEGKVTPK